MTTETKQASILDYSILTASTGEDAPHLEESWPVEYIEPFLHRADPLADKIVELLYEEGRKDFERSGDVTERPRRALQFLTLLINQMEIPDPEKEHPFSGEGSSYSISPEVRQALRDFLRDAQKLPPWIDFDLIKHAQALFADNPLLAYPLLAFLSLPVLYTCGRGGTQVLMLTEQIHTKVRRRIVETGSLIMTVMLHDSFTEPEKDCKLTNPLPKGIEAILRVRLLHAASRTIIYEFWRDGVRDREREANKPGDEPSKVRMYHGKPADQIWKAEWGVPISQEYLAGVLMSFSYLDLYGLGKLGVILSDKDKKSYMHFWNVFGYVLGVEEELLLKLDFPRTGVAKYEGGLPVHEASGKEMVEQGRALYTRVMMLNRATDEDGIRCGQALTKSIIDYLGDLLLRRVPWGKALQVERLPQLMMTMLLSKEDLELLGAKSSVLDRLIFPVILLILRLRGALAKTAPHVVNAVANLFFRYMREENDAVLAELEKKTGIRYPGIPLELQEKWGLVKNS